MNWLQNLSIKRKLTSVIMLVSSVALVIACLGFIVFERYAHPKTLERQLSVIAEMTADKLGLTMLLDEIDEADLVLNALKFDDQIVGACVYTTNSVAWAKFPKDTVQTFPEQPPVESVALQDGHLLLHRPVIFTDSDEKEELMGTSLLKASLSQMYVRLWLYVGLAFGVLVVSALLALALSTWLRRPIADPILALTQTSRKISSDNDYSVRAEKRSEDEIGELIDTFNGMLGQIEHRDHAEAAQQEAEKAKGDAERANRAKSDFLSFMSHELRTPLTSIIGFSEFLGADLESEGAGKERMQDVNRIYSSGKHLLELINDILDISKIEAGEWIVLQVRDTGIGMSEAERAKLFRAFTQADASTSRKYGGTGLGLALTKHLCQMMGGDVSVASQKDEGSTFTVELPAGRSDVEFRAPRVEPPTATVGKRGCILAIDDDPEVHRLLAKALSGQGYRLLFASNGREGMELAKKQPPDFITLDVLMPDMDGWTVLALLKEDEALCDIPVIILSVRADQEFGFSMGVTDYIQKPIQKERLLSALRRARPQEREGGVLVVEDDRSMREILRRMLEQEEWTVREAENGQVALESIARQCLQRR